MGVNRKAVFPAIGALVAAVLAWAWADGGREPVSAIEAPVAVPGAVR